MSTFVRIEESGELIEFTPADSKNGMSYMFNNHKPDQIDLHNKYTEVANSIPDHIYVKALLEGVPVIMRARQYRTKEIK